jgi:hypothetical protein
MCCDMSIGAAASFNALLSGIVKDLENDDEEGTLAFRCVDLCWKHTMQSHQPCVCSSVSQMPSWPQRRKPLAGLGLAQHAVGRRRVASMPCQHQCWSASDAILLVGPVHSGLATGAWRLTLTIWCVACLLLAVLPR